MADAFDLAKNEHVETLDSVPESIRSNYKESEGGGFVLVTPESKKQSATLAGLRDDKDELKSKLTEITEKYEADTTRFTALEEELNKLRESARNEGLGDRKEEFDKELETARKAMEEKWSGKASALEEKLNEVTTAFEQQKTHTERIELKRTLEGAFDDLEIPLSRGMRSDMIAIAERAFGNVDDEGNRFALDADGNKWRDGDGELLTPSGWATHQLELRPRFFDWPKGTGPNNLGGDPKVTKDASVVGNMSVKEYQQLREKQKSGEARAFGR